ncbi:oligogalacturonide lyase [Metabacillus malikii]|uniref:Oligogalacturonide lyase n=2 Tax=Metabacillus malikii TaxID=1504265 RepID=A0ABT9ZE95_9BACI|nr:oligogalacturonide lyase [Metabacillus malikii]
MKTFQDSLTGVSITQLTDYLAHSFHLYFTNNGWYDNESKLLFGSERNNSPNLYSMNLDNGEMTQLTDYKREHHPNIQGTYINPCKQEAYLIVDQSIRAINLETFEENVIFRQPQGFTFSNISCTADGKFLCFGLTEDLSKTINSNLSGGYIGFEEMQAAKPLCKIYLLTLNTGEVTVIHEEKCWIGHVNASPTKPNIITYCHEGPWEIVDHRIWVLDIVSGESWKIAECGNQKYAGHEYWYGDGVRIGFHGFTESLNRKDGKFIGSVNYDNTKLEMFDFPYQNMHIHSKNDQFIVGDGNQSIAYHGEYYHDSLFLWKKNRGVLEGPRLLCKHRASFHIQQIHVHPCIRPDQKKILFTSDQSGYGNLYIVDIPDFETLPKMKDGKITKNK